MFRIIALFFIIICSVFLVYGGMKFYERMTYIAPPVVRAEKTITIIEGWTLRDIASYFEKEGITSAKEFFAFTGAPAKIGKAGFRNSMLMNKYPFLLEIPEGGSLEGYLFPDTYRMYADATLEDVIAKILANFESKITATMKQDISAQHHSLYKIITMASVIEREVHTDADRPKVADIFWGRMNAGMPLQADSTVNYVTGKKIAAISSKDSRIDSPYNTYRYKGLPLGPISNPGIKSIHATLYPEKTPYVYFLTTREGEVKYGRTLDEHNLNKWNYLKRK